MPNKVRHSTECLILHIAGNIYICVYIYIYIYIYMLFLYKGDIYTHKHGSEQCVVFNVMDNEIRCIPPQTKQNQSTKHNKTKQNKTTCDGDLLNVVVRRL